MTPITLQQIESKQAEVAELIAKFKLQPAAAAVAVLAIAAVSIELKAGERYAGAVLDQDGQVKHHLVLLAARPEEDLDWQAAQAWASNAGGSLPTRQEQALLFANVKDALPERWCWSSEANGSSSAWTCLFGDGDQTCDSQSGEGCAVAVRRFTP